MEARGISPLIATLILIAATLAGGAFIFSVMRGSASRLSTSADFVITEASIVVTPGASLAFATVKNTGNITFDNIVVTVYTNDSNIKLTITMKDVAPGQSASGENERSNAWTVGRSYLMRFVGSYSGGSVTKTISVIAGS